MRPWLLTSYPGGRRLGGPCPPGSIRFLWSDSDRLEFLQFVWLAWCALPVGAENLLGRRDPAGVVEAKERQQEEDPRTNEGDYGGDPGDHADGPKGVGVQQQAAQSLTFKDRVDHSGELGVVRLGDCFGRELRVGLSAPDLDEVIGNEVIGVDLGLSTGRQLLAPYWRIAWNSGAATAALLAAGKVIFWAESWVETSLLI